MTSKFLADLVGETVLVAGRLLCISNVTPHDNMYHVNFSDGTFAILGRKALLRSLN